MTTSTPDATPAAAPLERSPQQRAARTDDAFISYSHAADSRLARELERGLERLARPWNRLRAMAVFRDENDLTLNPDLWGAISARLDRARFLILLLTPESAASPWVNKEVGHWCDRRGVDHVLLVWTGGELDWDDVAGDFTAGSTAVPASLRGRFPHEPLYLDLRWARDEPALSLAHPRFRVAVAQLAAPIRGTTPADLEGEDVRLRRRARRLARAAVIVVLMLAIVATVAAILAVRNAERAERRTREAVARQVGLAALDLPPADVDRALLMSLVAGRLDASDPARFQPAQVLIGRYFRLDRLLHVTGTEQTGEFLDVRSVEITDGGTIVATVGRADGSVALATWEPGERLADLADLPVGAGHVVSSIGGGVLLLSGGTGSAATVGPGGEVAALDGPVIAQHSRSDAVWVTSPDGSMLVRPDAAAPLATVTVPGLVDVRGDRAASLVAGELTVIDAATGASIAVGTAASDAVVLAVGPTDESAAAAGSSTAVEIFRRDGEQLVRRDAFDVPAGIGSPVWLAPSPDGERVLVVGTTSTALVDGDDAIVVPGGGATRAETDPSGRFVALGGSRLAVWDLETGQRTVTVAQLTSDLDWSGPCDAPTPCVLAVAGIAIDVLDPIAETRVRIVDEISAETVAVSPDGSTVVSGGLGATVAVWNVGPAVDDERGTELDGEELAELGLAPVDLDGECTATGLSATSPARRYAVSIDRDSATTVLCELGDDARRVAVAGLDPTTGSVTAVAVDDAGGVALGRSSGLVQHFAFGDGRFQQGRAIDLTIGGEPVDVTAVAARGDVVVAGVRPRGSPSVPARVAIWNVADGRSTTFESDHTEVAAVAVLDPVASAVVVAGRDTATGPVTVQLWESITRRRIGRAVGGLGGDVVVLAGLDTAVVGVDASGRALRWDVERDPTREVCAIAGRSLTAGEWEQFADGALARYDFDDPCAT